MGHQFAKKPPAALRSKDAAIEPVVARNSNTAAARRADKARETDEEPVDVIAEAVALVRAEHQRGELESPAAIAALALLLKELGRESMMITLTEPFSGEAPIPAADLVGPLERAEALKERTDSRGPAADKPALVPGGTRVDVTVLDGETRLGDSATIGAGEAIVKETDAPPIARPVFVYRVTAAQLEGVADAQLGREICRLNLIQIGFSSEHADAFLAADPRWTYRLDYGDGAEVGAKAIRAALAADKHIKVKIPAAKLDHLIRLARRGPKKNNAVVATETTEEQSMIRTLTDWIDSMTGTRGATYGGGDWVRLNAFLNGLIRFGGRLEYMAAGINRLVADGSDLVLPKEVGDIVRKYGVAPAQRWGDAMTRADTQVTIENRQADQTLGGSGRPFLDRLPGLLGENPEVVVASLLGPKGRVALAASAPLTTFLQSYGSGKSLGDSMTEAGWAAITAAISPIAGRYGVASELALDVSATYAILKARGRSDREIKEEIALTLLSNGVGGGRRAMRGGNAKRPGINRITDEMVDAARAADRPAAEKPAPKPKPTRETKSGVRFPPLPAPPNRQLPPPTFGPPAKTPKPSGERTPTEPSKPIEPNAPVDTSKAPLPRVELDAVRGEPLRDPSGQQVAGASKNAFVHKGDDSLVVKISKNDQVSKELSQGIRDEAEYTRRIDAELDGRRIAPEIVALVVEDGVVVGTIEKRIAGNNLADLAASGRLTQDQVNAIEAEVVRQLRALHKAGFVHGDMHSGNIMVSFDKAGKPIVKLVDFDMSVGRPDENSTRGTPKGDLESVERWFPMVRLMVRENAEPQPD